MHHNLLLALALLCSLPVLAKEYKVGDVPMVHLQNKLRYTINPDSILSSRTVYAIDTTLYSLEQRTGIQVMVAALTDIEGGDCFEFAYQLGQTNGVGQKEQNSGLVILLVTEERCIQFVTGYGLEGVLPDALCKQIQVRYMNKLFSKGDWDGGLLAGITAIVSVLNGTDEFTPVEEKLDNAGKVLTASTVIIIAIFILICILSWVSYRKSIKCPRCKKFTLQQYRTDTISRQLGIRTEQVTYRCSHCGYTKRKIRKTTDDSGIGGIGGPIIGGGIGGGFGGGSFGGGFSGGSFGGGSFGGGGAGSRF